MEMMARSGRLRSMSDEQIARESFEYAKNLKTIQSITGEDAKKMKDRAQKESEQAFAQMQLAKLGGNAAEKFQQVVSRLPDSMQRAVGQLALGEPITDPQVAAALQQSPELMKVLESAAAMVRDSSVSSTDFTKQLNTMLADSGEVIRKEVSGPGGEAMSRANYLLGSLSTSATVFADLLKMTTAVAAGRPGLPSGMDLQRDAQQATERAALTRDALTISLAGAETKFNQLQASLENNLMPAIERFATFVDKNIATSTNLIKEALAKFLGQTPPPTVPGAAQGRPSERELATAREQLRDPNLGRSDRAYLEALVRREEEANNPRRADGGLTYGPTLVGEDGTEAVIPLKGGNIPLKIDFRELVAAMDMQKNLTAELLDEIKLTRGVQERILNASY
jgi:hypothetical protein